MKIARYIELDDVKLAKGSHSSPADGMCAMELVAWLAGEPHSDHPKCTSSTIGAFARPTNDRFNDEERQLLKPALVACIGTADESLEQRRAFMCADAACRIFAPIALRVAGLDNEAKSLESLAEIVDSNAAANAANAAYYADNYAANAAYYAANAANYAANAAANAAHAAANAAHAAANAAHARKEVVDASIALLWRMIKLSWPDAKPVTAVELGQDVKELVNA